MKYLQACLLVPALATFLVGCVQVTVVATDGAQIRNSYLALSVDVSDQKNTTYTEVSGFGIVKVANELTIGYAQIERAAIEDDCTAFIWVEDAREFERVSDIVRETAGACLVMSN